MARHTGCDAHHVYTATRNEDHMLSGKGGVYMARHTGCDAHHVYTGTRNEAHNMSPSQGSQLRFTKMSSWCATLPRLTAIVTSVEISVFPAAVE